MAVWIKYRVTFELLCFVVTGGEEASRPGDEVACAVCAQCTVEASSHGNMEFALAWHMPVIQFGSKAHKHCRQVVKHSKKRHQFNPNRNY